MRDEYDFSDAQQNPYLDKLGVLVSLDLDTFAVDYFKKESDRTGIPYQRLINMYLVQCAQEEKHVAFA